MSAIKVFDYGSEEYARLSAVASVLTVLSPKGYSYDVGVTYFDYGQGWKWTTILCDGGKWGDFGNWGGYQALNPREQEKIINGADVIEVAKEILSDEHCPDRD